MSQTLGNYRQDLHSEHSPPDIVDDSGRGIDVVDSETASLETRMEVNSTTLATKDGQVDTFSCL